MIHLSFTHWPYIAASYGCTIMAVSALALQLTLRLRRARVRLALLEKNDRGMRPTS